MKMKKWSSQWTQFMQLREEAWKYSNGDWTRDLAIPVRCSTSWAMKPLTLGAGQFWVHIFPWKKWVLMIYEINHIWTADMKWKWRNDCGSERNYFLKKIQDLNGVWTCDLAIPVWCSTNWAMKPMMLGAGQLSVCQTSDLRCLISEVWCQPSVVRRLISGLWYQTTDVRCVLLDVWF